MRIVIAIAVLVLSVVNPSLRAGSQTVTLPGNLQILKADPPSKDFRFVGSSAPGQLFAAGEKAVVKLHFAQDAAMDKAFAIELQEITTRTDERITDMKGFSDTAGHAIKLGLEGKPIRQAIQPVFGKEFEVELTLPEKFGTYAMILSWADQRQFLGNVARLPARRSNGTLENTPVFGEGQFMDWRHIEERAQIYSRMGIRGWRSELSWSEDQKGNYRWDHYDRLFSAAEKASCKIMVTLGGHPPWTRPFGPPTPAARWHPKSGGYWGTGDWLCKPELYPRYGKWITAFCARYWKDGKGALWGLENYNEPWEGGGISGWARDCLEYRKIQKLIANSARKVSPDIRILAASSIMNTEDKFYSDGSKEFDDYVDIFTDHYVVPAMCYGPMVARAHGKESMETECWVVNSEFMLPQVMVQFMASGQRRLAPWHPRVLFDSMEGGVLIPTPVLAATTAFNYLVTGKSFEKTAFLSHLPWVFQFGKDDDRDGVLVLFGQLLSAFGKDPKERPWAQVEASSGGTLIIDNADGLLRFRDLAANPMYEGQQKVTLPLSILPTYIQCEQGPAAAVERIRQARIEGKRPVEILPRDFTRLLTDNGATLTVGIHNCLNRPVSGTLTVSAPNEVKLRSSKAEVTLAAGETKWLSFGIAAATPKPTNAYPFEFRFSSPAGDAEYGEVLHSAVARKRTIKIDGNLDDWKDLPGVGVIAAAQKAEASEAMRRPWLELKDQLPDGTFAEFKLAWDDDFLYASAQVHEKSPQQGIPRVEGRDENLIFHTKADDEVEPYKGFLAKYPGRSFAEVPYVYRWSPESPPPETGLPHIPFRRDRLHIALDVTEGWHDLAPTTDRVPLGFHAVPDTDYEYALYLCKDGSELWRMLAPGVPRIHDFPRQPRGERTTGPVAGAKHVVKLDGNVYTYEVAIPRAELANLKLEPGTTFGLMLRAGNNRGPHVDFGANKAVTKINGLTLRPYWERCTNCGVRWTLVE